MENVLQKQYISNKFEIRQEDAYSMYKTILLSGIIILLFIFSPARGQENFSITKDIYSGKDTNYIKALINKGSKLYERYPDSSLQLFTCALTLCRDMGFERGKAKALLKLGSVYFNRKNYDRCISYCEEILAMNPQYITKADLAYVYSNLGKAYSGKVQYQKASYFSQKTLALLFENNIKDTGLIIDAYLELGIQQGALGNKDKALHYMQQAESLCKEINDTVGLSTVIANMVMIDNKKEHAFQALNLGKATGNHQARLRGASTLCTIYASEGETDSAFKYMKMVKQIAGELSDDKSEFISASFNLASIQYLLKDYKAAEQTLRETLEDAEKWHILDHRIPPAHQRLASLYEQHGAYQQAFEQQKKAMETYSRFLSETDAENAKELEARYLAAQKDKALAQKQLQISQQKNKLAQKNMLIGGISLGAIMLGIIFYSRARVNKQKQLSQEKQIFILKQQQDLLKKEMEINHLKDRIEGEEKERLRIARELHDGVISQLIAVKLHFKGALQNIRDKERFEPPMQYLDDATNELRTTTHNLMPENVLQSGLLHALHNYCKKMEMASGIKIYFEHFGDLQIRDKNIELSLYRIVQELVQNAIKHAQASHILVELNAEDTYLTLTVEDNGTGCTQTQIEESAGIGLKSIQSRIKALEGTFEISCGPDKGTAVNIEFNLKESLSI